MQLKFDYKEDEYVVISFQFSTFVSLMQQNETLWVGKIVVISFQFSTFVSLMQPKVSRPVVVASCD